MTGSILASLTNSASLSFNHHIVRRASSPLQRALRGVTSSRSGTPGRKALVINLDKRAIARGYRASVTTIVETNEDSATIHFIDEALEDALSLRQRPMRSQPLLRPPHALPQKQEPIEQATDEETPPAPSHLRSLVHGFHERQREASLIVAASLGAAIVLTLCGMLVLFTAITPRDAGQGPSADKAGIAPQENALNTQSARRPLRLEVEGRRPGSG